MKTIANLYVIFGVIVLHCYNASAETNEWFPLATGNTWVYQHRFYENENSNEMSVHEEMLTIEVINMVKIDDTTYYEIHLDRRIEHPLFFSNESLYRTDTYFIYRYEPTLTKDALFIDLRPCDEIECKAESENLYLFHNEYKEFSCDTTHYFLVFIQIGNAREDL